MMKKTIIIMALTLAILTSLVIPAGAWENGQTSSEEITVSASARATYIGKTKAKQIALAKAKGKNARITEIELDKEDGIMVYEGEMVDSKYEYDFEINAKTGKIIEWERERRDRD